MTTLSLAIPDTFATEERDMRIRTWRIGELGRLAAIFNCERIFIFPDQDEKVTETIRKQVAILLAYQFTAPYLRKDKFPRNPALKYANILPPLQRREISEKQREGMVMRTGGPNALISLGESEPIWLPTPTPVKTGDIVLVQKKRDWNITGIKTSRVQEITQKELAEHTLIGLSRLGKRYTPKEIRSTNDHLTLVAGNAWRGITQLLPKLTFEKTWNIMERQGTKTIRTDEAIAIAIARLH